MDSYQYNWIIFKIQTEHYSLSMMELVPGRNQTASAYHLRCESEHATSTQPLLMFSKQLLASQIQQRALSEQLCCIILDYRMFKCISEQEESYGRFKKEKMEIFSTHQTNKSERLGITDFWQRKTKNKFNALQEIISNRVNNTPHQEFSSCYSNFRGHEI